MDFYSLENADGVRFSWNNLPASKVTANKAMVPISVFYTPMKDLDNLALVEYTPLKCKCGGILNPYCTVEFKQKLWICPFCGCRTPFPQAYADFISEENLPAELIDQYTTIEYTSQQEKSPNVFLFVVDTCLEQSELEVVRDSIQQSLNIIPADSYVGLITFGKYVFLHELGYAECPKSYAFNGLKDYTPQQIQEQLGISVRNDPRGGSMNNPTLKRFLLPLSECEFTFNSILDDLSADSWVTPSNERQKRATGTAYNIAVSLLEASQNSGNRILSFIGGACTYGPGQVIGVKLEENIRSYMDLQKENENCKYYKKAEKFYQTLAQRAVRSSLVIDMLCFTLEQFGLLEMRSLSELTGGYVVVNEQFNCDVFRESYKKFFEEDQNGHLKMGFSAKLEILVSKDLKVNGAIGPCLSLKKNSPMVSDTEIGQSKTVQWHLGGIDKSTTICCYLDLASSQKPATSKMAYVQFQTQYKHSNGDLRLRVTTVTRKFAEENNMMELSHGFDQEAACVAMARWGVLKAEKEEPLEVLKWLDRSLIRVVCRFSDFKKDNVNSFKLNKEFSLYPQFMYHLRRSHFIQVFGTSPDEASFYKCTLMRENTTNSLVMIQPALLQYNFDDPQPVAVNLDIDQLKSNVILLLDTYFHVIIWQGERIKKWQDKGYQDLPEYDNFRELLAAPQEDVQLIMEDRFPTPLLIQAHQGSGKERYLKSKVNPSSIDTENSESGNFITDDASLKVFMDHLVKLVVQTQNN